MNLASHLECTGCGACASVCPKRCIQMKIEENGFFYPHVNHNNCIDCGLCTQNCHIFNKKGNNTFEKIYFCGWDSSEIKRFEGSSGGIFGALAEFVIATGGIVYGAVLSSDKKTLSHQSTKDVSLSELKKSKYVESDMNFTISRIKKDLRNGHFVLFCGTPCQTYGVRKVFEYKYENLLLCDFFCHGVPSQIRYQQYLKELEDKYGAPVEDIGFRTKKYGWKTYCIVVNFKNGKQYVKLANEDPYYKHFFSNTNIRPSCYNCNRVANSEADITLGDFWEARKKGYSDDDKGISLIICNTEKGKHIISKLNSIELKKIKKKDIEYAFVKHSSNEIRTPLDKPFFEAFTLSIKDRFVCAALKISLLRKIVYKLK